MSASPLHRLSLSDGSTLERRANDVVWVALDGCRRRAVEVREVEAGMWVFHGRHAFEVASVEVLPPRARKPLGAGGGRKTRKERRG